MRAKVDENLPLDAVALLREAGWECDTVFDEGLDGAPDAAVAAACHAEARVLFTLDLDFADIRTYPPSRYAGIVVLRPLTPSRRAVLELMARAVAALSAEWAPNRLWVVEPQRVRIKEAHTPKAVGPGAER